MLKQANTIVANKCGEWLDSNDYFDSTTFPKKLTGVNMHFLETSVLIVISCKLLLFTARKRSLVPSPRLSVFLTARKHFSIYQFPHRPQYTNIGFGIHFDGLFCVLVTLKSGSIQQICTDVGFLAVYSICNYPIDWTLVVEFKECKLFWPSILFPCDTEKMIFA